MECFARILLIRKQEMKGLPFKTSRNPTTLPSLCCFHLHYYAEHGFHDNALFPQGKLYPSHYGQILLWK